ncbi:AraC family transcriptional regulator [Paenibacillus sp. CGMCC 1.16610]|uniref:Helix-turn-helix domain-containing protein n=1 Tax=Paenibacillus anseongense TaxID=2682845 RepID=A0ABW9UA11_9BACL|nr:MULTISPECIES: AraC family transcriptional regulator [Paenibacillus]MBA2938687.1 AraC family transcriptional regulator [Paenibacillus sp. CGMCC 1.16610]MVQ34650.1 helix-turn-helix domain-containing protein [Paenibacillus anseongense]
MNWRHLQQTLNKNRLFFKILLYFLSLLIPIVILGVIAYLNADQLIKKDASGKLTDNLVASSKTIDIYLGMAQSTNNSLLLSDTIQQYLRPYPLLTDEEKIKLPSIVRSIAGNRNTISHFVDNIFLFVDDQRVYFSDGMVDFDVFFDTFYKFDGYNKDFWRQQLHESSLFELLTPTRVANPNMNTNRDVIPSVTTQYLNGHLATMVTTISIPTIAATLQNNSIFSTTHYIVMDKDNQIILQSGGLEAKDVEQIVAGFSKEKASNGALKIGQDQNWIVQTTSEYGWKYYSITPVSSFNQESSSIFSLIIWICISLIIIGIAFSAIFSVRLYNPIKNIRDILQKTERIEEGNQETPRSGELQRIGNSVSQLVQQHKDANMKIHTFSEEILEQFFTNLIKGVRGGQPYAVNQILKEIDFHTGTYLCCCFVFMFRDQFYHDILEADRLLIFEKMKNVLWGIMKKYVNCYLVEYEPYLYVCMVNLKSEADREQLEQALEMIKMTFAYDTMYCELVIGLGKRYDKIEDYSKSYSDAITAIDKRTDSSKTVIVDAAHLDIDQNYYYSFLDETKIVNKLKSGDRDGLRGELEGIIALNKARGVSYHFLGALLVEFFHTGNRYLTEKGLRMHDFLEANEHDFLSQKELLPTEFDARLKMIFEFYDKMITETLYKPESKSGTVVSLITAYIEKHYEKDLYLEVIANEIGLSAKYVSRMFKETTGTNISDYISLIRIAKAKELLAHTDIKISDIADQIGIFSRTTFLRLFKKHEGISPNEYRQIHGGKQK